MENKVYIFEIKHKLMKYQSINGTSAFKQNIY